MVALGAAAVAAPAGAGGVALSTSLSHPVHALMKPAGGQRGFIGSRVRTAYAHDNGSVILDVIERRVSATPVVLTFVKPWEKDSSSSSSSSNNNGLSARIENGRAKASLPPSLPPSSPTKGEGAGGKGGGMPGILAPTASTPTSSTSLSPAAAAWAAGRAKPEGALLRLPAMQKGEPPLVVCKGRTQAKVIAQALGLKYAPP
ncbi:Hypothetical protein NocV09_02600980, partial [Nannochloropsis oceanica]